MEFVGSAVSTALGGRSRNGGGCNPCVALLLGVLFVCGSVFALWTNEFNSVTVHATLMEAERLAISVPSNSELEGLGGRLVAIQGTLKAASTGANDPSELRDDALGVTTHGVKLRRETQMYQWRRVTHSRSGRDEIEYVQEWSEKLLADASDAHRNPSVMPYSSKVFEADALQVGRFSISQELDNQVNWFKDVTLKIHSGGDPIARKRTSGTDVAATRGNEVVAAVDASNLPKWYHLNGEHAIVTTQEGRRETVGDMKITYSAVPEGPVSILAEITGKGKLKTWMPKKVPESSGIAIIAPGEYTLAELIKYQARVTDEMTNMIRIGGILFSIVGWYLMMSPIEWVASFIPIFGSCVSCGLVVLSLALGLSISLTIISFAWLFYRPLYAVPMICLCVTMAFYTVQTAAEKESHTISDTEHEARRKWKLRPDAPSPASP